MTKKTINILNELQNLRFALKATRPTGSNKMHQALDSLVRNKIAEHKSGKKVDLEQLYEKIKIFQDRHNNKSKNESQSKDNKEIKEIDGHELVGESVDLKKSDEKKDKNSGKNVKIKKKKGVKKND
jgi:hypothetical protein